jgi:hypothetical protein
VWAVTSYEVTVGDAPGVRVRSLQAAQTAVMEGVTDLVARDPEGASEGAIMANQAFAAGTVSHVLETHGRWQTVITVHGERITVAIRKRRWW